MKKIPIIITLITLLPCIMQAQTAYDALRFSQIFYSGTARSAAMGNAMTALGGDFGSLAINPAGSAVFPYSEFTITPVLNHSITKADYLSTLSDQNRSCLDLANIGYIGSIKLSNQNGLTGLSLGFGYNALNDFTDRFSASGVTNQSSWLAGLAYNTSGIHATNLDLNEYTNPFYNSSAPWRAILAWNTSLLDTIPGSQGMYYKGVTEAYSGNNIVIPGNLQQDFFRESKGYVGEYVINLGLNFSHKLFLGVNMGVQSIYYYYNEQYTESADNWQDFPQTEFNYFTHTYNQSSSGVGVNFKVGAIYLPAKNVRIGAAISTPTWMRLNEEWEETITADFSDGYHQYLSSPLGTYEYRINTPFRWNVGMAYTLGTLGAISIDYEQTAYNKIYLSSTGTNATGTNPFSNENNYIKKEFTNTHNIRAGLELNLNEAFSIRGGYAYYGGPEKSYSYQTQIASLGIGLHSGSLFSDLTFMQQFAKKEYFSLYDDVYDYGYVVYQAPIGEQTASNWKLLLTIGLRF